MNLERYREKLLAQERELLESMAKVKEEALEASGPEVQDEMDQVTGSEQKAALLKRNSLEFETLVLVREALARMDAGTYGQCQFCGRPIGEKRLDAIPWAAYDLEHQEQRDRETDRETGGSEL